MNKKLRILIVVGILLIVAIITKIAFADTDGNTELTEDQIIALGEERLNRIDDAGHYDSLTEEEINILSKYYVLGNACTEEFNGEQVLTVDDAYSILELYLKYSVMYDKITDEGPTKAEVYVADLNRNGEIEADDASALLRYLVAHDSETFDGTLEEFMNAGLDIYTNDENGGIE